MYAALMSWHDGSLAWPIVHCINKYSVQENILFFKIFEDVEIDYLLDKTKF